MPGLDTLDGEPIHLVNFDFFEGLGAGDLSPDCWPEAGPPVFGCLEDFSSSARVKRDETEE